MALNLYAPGAPTVVQRIIASLLIALCTLPIALWFTGRQAGQPLLPFLGLAHGTIFALPIFLRQNFRSPYWKDWLSSTISSEPRVFDDTLITQALLLTLLAWIFFLAGYFGCIQKLWGRKCQTVSIDQTPCFKINWKDNYRLLKFLGVAFGAVGAIFFYIESHVTIGDFYSKGIVYPVLMSFTVRFIDILFVLGMAILFLLQRKGQLGPAGKFFLWGVLFIPCTWFGITSGMGHFAIKPSLVLILTYATDRDVNPWKVFFFATILGVITVMLIMPLRMEIRGNDWLAAMNAESGRPLDNVNVTKRIDLPASSLSQTWDSAKAITKNVDRSKKFAFTRIDHLISLTHMMDMTPKKIPYWNGETYLHLAPFKVYRHILGKETPALGRQLAHEYGFISRSNTISSIAIPQIIELYINFGIWGIFIGMYLIGWLYRMFQTLCIHKNASLGTTAAAIPIILILLFGWETTAASTWGSLTLICYISLLAVFNMDFVKRKIRILGKGDRKPC